MTKNRTLPLVECAIMIALATVLSMVKLAELPYGGSITIASMLPIAMLIAEEWAGDSVRHSFMPSSSSFWVLIRFPMLQLGRVLSQSYCSTI